MLSSSSFSFSLLPLIRPRQLAPASVQRNSYAISAPFVTEDSEPVQAWTATSGKNMRARLLGRLAWSRGCVTHPAELVEVAGSELGCGVGTELGVAVAEGQMQPPPQGDCAD